MLTASSDGPITPVKLTLSHKKKETALFTLCKSISQMKDLQMSFLQRFIKVSTSDPASSPSFTPADSFAHYVDAVPDSYAAENHNGLPIIPPLSHSNLKEKQLADPNSKQFINWKQEIPLLQL